MRDFKELILYGKIKFSNLSLVYVLLIVMIKGIVELGLDLFDLRCKGFICSVVLFFLIIGMKFFYIGWDVFLMSCLEKYF